MVLLLQCTLHFLLEDIFVEQVLHSDARPVDLVGIGGANSATGRTNLSLAEEPFGDSVLHPEVRGEDVRIGGYPEVRNIRPPTAETVEFLKEHLKVNDNTVRNDGDDSRCQNARGQQGGGGAFSPRNKTPAA